MTTRTASCSCGNLRVTCEGDPVRVSMCHCLACQQRTGSVFGVQARFAREQITQIEGASSEYVRTGDSGGRARFHFCPSCGSTVYWELDGAPGIVGVAVGAFADPHFGTPTRSVYESRRHAWVHIPDAPGMEHRD
ncbi:MAG TPA: GFA family protein [Casimicrobiaceae bacterium]|nr:GFA family protein [Casimicrobiaceae bacterium]